MATASDIITNAMEALGILNRLNPVDDFIQERGFKQLIRLINRWSSVGIDINITIPTVPASELGNPPSTDDALITSLAIDMQKIAKTIASGALRKDQKIYYRQMKAAFGLHPEQQFGSNMPYGAGNNFGPRQKRYFVEPNSVGADSNDSLGL